MCFLTVRGRWERIILAVRLAHFPYFIYSWTSPLPLIRASALLAGLILPLYKCSYFMDDPPSVRLYIYIQFLLQSSLFVFSKIMLSDRNLETEKKTSGFSRKILFALKWAKKAHNGVFLRFHKVLSLFFAESNLKKKK